jgi:hypothetical protein
MTSLDCQEQQTMATPRHKGLSTLQSQHDEFTISRPPFHDKKSHA